MNPTKQNQFSLQWIAVSFLLLALYLGFFHCCLGATYQMCITYGVCFWLAWMAVCRVASGVFLKRFEFGMYQLVGIDILLEGFSPLHTGHGFYWCAFGFWAVFVTYRLIPANSKAKAKIATEVAANHDAAVPELSSN